MDLISVTASLIAPDKFKGSLEAAEVAAAVADRTRAACCRDAHDRARSRSPTAVKAPWTRPWARVPGRHGRR